MPATNSKSGALSERLNTLHHSLQRNHLVLVACACVVAVVWADHPALHTALLFLVSLLLSLWVSPRLALTCLLIAVCCGTLHRWRTTHRAEQSSQLLSQHIHEGRFHIISPVRMSSRSWSAHAKYDGKKIEIYGRYPAPSMGTALHARAIIQEIKPPRNEGEFDHANWLKRNGVLASMRLIQSNPLPEHTNKIHYYFDQGRAVLRTAITHGLTENSDEAKVIRAMVLGEQPERDDAVLQAFQLSGTLHLFSVSGQHVNLVALILWFVLRKLRVPRTYAIAFLIPAIFSYAWVTGATPPAVRAAWMASVFLAAFWFQRKPHILGALAIVMIAALFIDSNLIFQAGVQLSYGVVAAISIGLSLTSHAIHRWSLLDDYLPRDLYTQHQEKWVNYRQKFAQGISVSSAACLGSAPLGLFHFGIFTPVSILANLFMTPCVCLLLALALASAVIFPLTPRLSSFLNHTNALVARACIHISETCASLPGAHWQYSPHTPDQDAIRIFDLPHGAGATMLQLHDADLLLDTGSIRNSRTLNSSLNHFACSPDTIMLSHAESEHIGYAAQALETFTIKQIIAPVSESRSTSFRKLLTTTADRQIPTYLAKPSTLPLSKNVTCTLLLTPGCNDKRLAADDRVCLHLLHYHGFHILFAHDTSPSDLYDIWKNLPTTVDVLVLGRHHQNPWPIEHWPQHPPRLIIASHASFPEHEKLPDAWKSFITSLNIPIISQQDSGMVTLSVDPNGNLHAHGFLSGSHTLRPLLPE